MNTHSSWASRCVVAVVMLAFAMATSALAQQSIVFSQRQCQNLAVADGGESLTATIVPQQKLEAYADLPVFSQAGWYLVTGEYKTTGLDPMGQIVLDVSGIKILPWQPFSAASEWVPFQIYCQTAQPGTSARLRLVAEPAQIRAAAGAQVQLRRVEVRTFSYQENVELLGNADFSQGQIGQLPAQWQWAYFGRSGDYSLATDQSFRTGSQTLRIISENTKDARTITGTKMPVPKAGKLSFSVWGRSDDAQVTMVLYLLTADYKWIKTINLPLTATWQQQTLEVDVPENPSTIYLIPRVDIKGAGTASLAGASLKWTAKSGQETGAASSGSKIRNMLSNPDMELGLNGWMFDYFMPGQPTEAVRQIRSEESGIVGGAGVDHSSAMRVAPRNCLISHCVPVTQGKQYTISAYLKASSPDDSATLYLLDPGWKIYSKKIQGIPADRWQRYSFTLTVDKPIVQKKAYLRIDPGNHTLWVDRAQVEEGPLSDYQSPPVMLGILQTQQVFSRGDKIVGVDAEILTASAAPARVELQIKDAWGRDIRPARQLALDKGSRTSVPLTDLPTDRLGIISLQLAAYDVQGQVLVQTESRYAVLDAPAQAMLPTGFSLFGIGYEINTPLWVDRRMTSLYSRMGVGVNRFFFSGDLMKDENYRSALRDQLKLQADAGMKTIIANCEFTKEIKVLLDQSEEASPEALNQIDAYLREVVPAMKGTIQYWEILNEGNIWNYADGPRKGQRSMKPAKYVPILRRAYETIKSIDPSAKVAGFALAGADFDYLHAAMQLGAASYMDIFTWHPYRDAPDMPDTFADLQKAKAILKQYGFNGPTMNGEQYYSANLYMFHNHDEEVRRRYIVGEKDEMWATGRIMQNFIHHAAAQVPWCIFAPPTNLARLGGQDDIFLYYSFGAYNAATRMLNNAGAGVPLRLGGDCRAFFFPQASDGPLLALYTLLPEFSGRMKLSGIALTATDMMGNDISAEELASAGIPIQVSPVYVRFPAGTQANQVQQLLNNAEISGLGEPFNLRLTILPDGHLGVLLTNRMNQSASGQVKLLSYPQEWKLTKNAVPFGPLAGNATATLVFDGKFALNVMDEYKVTVLAENDHKFTRQDLRLAPLFADMTDHPAIGASVSQWSQWFELGENNLSTEFSAERPHQGPADLSARLALGWDQDGLTLAVVVRDDVAKFPTAPGDFNCDSLQIYFDQKNNAENPKSRYDGDDVAYYVSIVGGKPMTIIEKGQDGRFLGAANQTTGLDPDVQVSITRQNDQTIYQMRFPAKCLPQVAFEPGSILGFSILINDNDGNGRKTGLTLAPKGDEPYNKPYFYRTLILRKR